MKKLMTRLLITCMMTLILGLNFEFDVSALTSENVTQAEKKEVKSISATVTTPVIGKHPSELKLIDFVGEGYEAVSLMWWYYDDEVDDYCTMEWRRFEPGMKYRCSLIFETKDGYTFPDNRSDLVGKINGNVITISDWLYSNTSAWGFWDFDFDNELEITEQPNNQTVTEGSNVTFKVVANGDGLKYQWQFKNATATAWSNSTMTGANTNNITVKATAARNGYQYRCVVKDASGNKVTSNAAKLTVTQGLKITGQPTSASVSAGTKATFKVTASGSNLTYQWQFKNASATYWSDSTMAGAKTNSITVTATEARNGYQYRCVVKDGSGNKVTSNAAKLTVTQGLKITGQPTGASVSAGAKATFKVTASGSNLTYQWQFKNASATYWSDSTMAGAKTNSITVTATEARNGYQYRCVVKDGSGNKVTSNAAKLTVTQGLKITGQPTSASVSVGAKATFKVTASGSDLTYQWQFKNASATYWSNSTMTGAKTNSITVTATEARNGYQYRCVVKDGSGNKVTSNAATLTIK